MLELMGYQEPHSFLTSTMTVRIIIFDFPTIPILIDTTYGNQMSSLTDFVVVSLSFCFASSLLLASAIIFALPRSRLTR